MKQAICYEFIVLSEACVPVGAGLCQKPVVTLRGLITYCPFQLCIPDVRHWLVVETAGYTVQDVEGRLLMLAPHFSHMDFSNSVLGSNYTLIRQMNSVRWSHPAASYVRLQSSAVGGDSPFVGGRGSCPPPPLPTFINWSVCFPGSGSGTH